MHQFMQPGWVDVYELGSGSWAPESGTKTVLTSFFQTHLFPPDATAPTLLLNHQVS